MLDSVKKGLGEVSSIVSHLIKSPINFVGSLTGLWHRKLYNGNPTEKFSQTNQERHLDKYSDSMSIDSQFIPDAKGFNTYSGTRISAVAGLPDTLKTPEGVNIKEKLLDKTDANATLVRDALNNSLKFAPSDAAQKKFTSDMIKVKAFVEDPESKYSPTGIALFVTEIRNEAVTAIKSEHEAVLKAIDANFENPEFVNALKATLGINSDDQLGVVKDTMCAHVEKSMKDALQAFEKNLSDPIVKLHDVAQKERERVSFLATISENDKTMQKEVARLYGENQARHNTARVTGHLVLTDNKALFKGMNVEDLEVIKSINAYKGWDLKGWDVKKVGKGEFRIDFPDHMFNPAFYSLSTNNSKQYIRTLVQSVRACGYDGIEIEIDPNEGHGLEMARESYEEAIEAGFEPKNIKIKYNNKTYDAKNIHELFQDEHSHRPQVAMSKASKTKEAVKEAAKTPPIGFAEMKKQIRQIPDDIASKAKKPATAPAPSGPAP